MRTLFVKIFLSVLLTVLLTFAGGFAIAVWVMPRHDDSLGDNRGPGGPRGRDPGDRTVDWNARQSNLIETYALSVEETLATKDLDTAIKQLDTLGEWWEVETYLLDQAGEEVRGREVPAELKLLAQRVCENGTARSQDPERGPAVACCVRAPDGSAFVFIGQGPGEPSAHRGGPPGPPSLFWIAFSRIAPVAVTLALVCFVLARYITKPVLTMRSALRRFGDGDLAQRVGATVGERRDEIGELARDFDHMAERIETLLGAQRRLLQDISHELRSPLARQRVALELARQGGNEVAARSLDRAEREAERLDELVGQLLALTRLESASDEGARTRVDLAALVSEIVENAEFEAQDASRSVRLTASEACVVNAVGELLRRAVENVVRNAVAYTAEGTTVEVSLTTSNGDAIVRVRDHGPGVPESELADIFQPFYRVSHARERQTGGVGLGLAIVQRAVRSHGGQVIARNEASGGLLVEIRLPRDRR